nr:AraC family transcriptional regulator [Vibrio anguillarum]
GMEFAATYFVMLMVLFIYGGGRYVSLDYWLKKPFTRTPQTA